MIMKKMYIAPQIMVVEMEVESLLTQFSSAGNIEGPVGSKPHDFNFEFSDGEEYNSKSKSIWDEE